MDTVPSLQYYSDSNLIPPATSPTHSQHSTKKRRASNSTSARGVANLNPEQLAKKRANDREAQRAIRERTKTQIETLERRIQELTTQQPYQELRLAIQQKEQVEAENEEIKRRLNSFINGIQPLIGGNGQVGRESYAAHWGNPSLTDLAAEPIPPCHATVGLPHALNSIVNHVGQPIGPQAAVYPDARSLPSTLSISRYPASRGQRNTTPSTSQSAHTGSPDTFSAVNVLERRVPSVSHALPNRTYEEKLEAAYLQNLHDARNGRQQYGRERAPSLQSTLPMNPLSPIQNPRDSFGNQLLACSVPVRNIPPACPLDGLLLDFLAERRQKAIEGVPSKELVGPDYPSVVTLLDPKRSPCSHPLSKVFTDMLVTFPDLSTLPEQVAVLYVMFLIMRWQILPTQENYDRLPDWITPRPSQLFSPHPAWVDYLPWPRMRDRLCQLYPEFPFDEFFIPYTTTLSLNWPYEARDVLLIKENTDELIINPIFEKHLRVLDHWTLGPAFANAHPRLANTATIKTPADKRKNA